MLASLLCGVVLSLLAPLSSPGQRPTRDAKPRLAARHPRARPLPRQWQTRLKDPSESSHGTQEPTPKKEGKNMFSGPCVEILSIDLPSE